MILTNKKLLLMFVILFQLILIGSCSKNVNFANEDGIIPLHNKVVTGQLDNGLKYYILENDLPSNKVEFRLNVRSGSLNETEKERGLAHFLEHMTFKGTKNFPDNTIVKFLEAAGLSFGPDTNAYTSFDNTNYQLSIPYDNESLISDAFKIFRDWAGDVVFKKEDFEKERGVILEEERVRDTYYYRMYEKRFKEMHNKSLFSERLPIGLINIIKNATIQDLEDYYKKWYRPNNMSVVIVGKIDPKYAEKIIIEKFSDLKNSDTPVAASREVEIVKGLRVKEIAENEAKFVQLEMNYFYPGKEDGTIKSYKHLLMLEAISSMFNRRVALDIKENKLDLQSLGLYQEFLGNNYSSINFSASLNKGDYKKYLDVFLTEIEKVKRYGFSAGELAYFKKFKENEINNLAQDGYRLESKEYAELLSNFDTLGGYFTDFKTLKVITDKILNDLTLKDYNDLIKNIMSSEDRLFLTYLPSSLKNKIKFNKVDIEAALDVVSKKEIKKIDTESSLKSLEVKNIKPSEIVKKIKHENISATEFVYSNGARLFVKKDQNKFQEFNLYGSKLGGSSIMNNREVLLVGILEEALINSGFKDISNRELSEILVDKEVSFGINSYDYYSNYAGKGKTKDIETLFQLLHRSATAFEIDNNALEVIKDSYKLNLELAEKDKKVLFKRTVNEKKYNNNYRRSYLLSSDISSINKEELEYFYKKHWTNEISNFVFTVVGDVDVNAVGELGAKYIGSIKASENKAYTTDRKVRFNKHFGEINGKVENDYKSTLDFSLMKEGPKYEYGQFLSDIITQVLEIRLRESIREELGGTYGVNVGVYYSLKPTSIVEGYINLTYEPIRKKEIKKNILSIFNDFSKKGITQKELDIAKGILKNIYTSYGLENSYWASSISVDTIFDLKKYNISEIKKIFNNIKVEDVNKFINEYLKDSDMFITEIDPGKNVVKK